MTSILLSVAIVGGIGLLAGTLLAVVSALCKGEEENPLLQEIRDALPGANCGVCGFAGCDSYAEAVANGLAEPNLCAPGGVGAAASLSVLLGIKVEAVEKTAVVRCAGCNGNVDTKFDYSGPSSCKAAAALGGGFSDCEYGCLGLGDCVKVCPFKALSVVDGLAVVDVLKCTGCGKCTKVCPKEILTLQTKTKTAVVPCRNLQKGAIARKICKTACIGCGACKRVCEQNAVTVENFLATIDPQKCIACGKCVSACPQKIIIL